MFWAGYIIGCLLCAAICYAIMQNKGYEQPTGWFFAGLFLSVIGIILVLVQPKATTSYQSINSSERITKSCPSCGAQNNLDADRCSRCGRNLHTATRGYDTWVCKCGARNESSQKTCHRCGTENSAQQKKKVQATNWICICGTRNEMSSKICSSCGKEYEPAGKTTYYNKEAKKTNTLAQQSASTTETTVTKQLQELKKLLDQGLITQEDFDAKKKQILNL